MHMSTLSYAEVVGCHQPMRSTGDRPIQDAEAVHRHPRRSLTASYRAQTTAEHRKRTLDVVTFVLNARGVCNDLHQGQARRITNTREALSLTNSLIAVS